VTKIGVRGTGHIEYLPGKVKISREITLCLMAYWPE